MADQIQVGGSIPQGAQVGGAIPQGASVGGSIPSGATVGVPGNGSQDDSLLDKLGHFAEDVAYPTVGAAGGAVLGTEGGPAGMAAGAALGGAAGEEVKRGVRSARGRDDLNPSGWGHVSDDATSAASGVMQELPAALKASQSVGKIIPAIMQDAENMGIKLSPGSTGGRALSWIENHLRANPGTSSLIKQGIDKDTNQSVLNAGRQLADHISQASLGSDPQILGNTIADTGASIEKNASKMYDDALDTIKSKGADQVPINLTSPVGPGKESVQQTAERMLYDLTSNRGSFSGAFKDAQSRQMAIDTLEQFANSSKTIPGTKATAGFAGKAATPATVVPKQLSWDGARSLVSDMGAVIRRTDTDLGKGALTQLKTALQNSMQTSLDSANPGLGTMFRNASSNYAKVQDTMSNSVVQHLMENKSPESAAKFLLANGSAISNTQALTTALTQGGVKGATMNDVSGSVLNELLTQSTNKANGTLKTGDLLSKWNGLGDAGQKVLFPNPTQRQSIQKFMSVADRYAFPVPTKTAGQVAGQSGGMGKAAIGAAGAAVGAAAFGHYGFALPILGASAAIHIAPSMALKLLENPQGAEALSKAVSSPVATAAHKMAIQTVLQLTHHLGDQ